MRHALQISGLKRFPFWADSDFFDDVFSAPVERKQTRDFHIDENEEAFVLSVDLPGVRREDIRLNLVNDVLTLSGTRGRQVRSRDGKGFEVAKGL